MKQQNIRKNYVCNICDKQFAEPIAYVEYEHIQKIRQNIFMYNDFLSMVAELDKNRGKVVALVKRAQYPPATQLVNAA